MPLRRGYMNPELSIIVPMYNVGKTIRACIESILASDYSDYELLLVDDGSNDDTVSICKSIKNKDSRLRILQKENSGAGLSRQYGLERANGKYVAFVDGDDVIHNRAFSTIISFMNKEKLQMCFFGYAFDKLDGKTEIIEMKYEKQVYLGSEIREKIQKNAIYYPNFKSKETQLFAVWQGIYSREFILKLKIKFVNERKYWSEDSLFNLTCLAYSERIGFLNDIFYRHCEKQNSLSKVLPKSSSEMNMWYKKASQIAGTYQNGKYVIPYLKSQYLREFNKMLTDVVSVSGDFYKNYRIYRERFYYLKEISICDIKGITFKEKIKFFLLMRCCVLYRLCQIVKGGIHERK